MKLLLKRLVWGWRMRVWPWKVPSSAARALPFSVAHTKADIRRTQELAERYGWKR